MNNDFYKINTEKSKTNTLIFKDKDDNLNSVIDSLNSNKKLPITTNGKKIRLSKTIKKSNMPLDNKKSLKDVLKTLPIKRFIIRLICFIMAIGILAITFTSAFIGMR